MPSVQYLEASVESLRPNTFNPNRVSVDNESKIRASIERNGLFKPIVVREVAGLDGYEIIGGQHRWEQAKALGHATVPIVNLGQITESRAKEICLIDNARYGVDDTLILGDILKEIGDFETIQDFLPYGDTDLAAIFSAASIDLNALELPLESLVPEQTPEAEGPTAKPVKTHTVMRFKIENADAERLTALIARTQRQQGLTQEDQLTNAGDALVYLLRSQLGLGGAQAPTTNQPEDWSDMLDQIEAARQESDA